MGTSLISNPPYNLKWELPTSANFQARFEGYDLPPESNANYAFILSALDFVDNKAVLLLPNCVLDPNNAKEKAIKEQLIKQNLLEAVIALPDKMFVSTSISTCILVFNKCKKTTAVELVDLRQSYVEEQRNQNGQFGGNSHEKRTYYKTFKVVTDETMKKVVDCIQNQTDIPELAKSVTIQEIEDNDYAINPSKYILFQERETKHRPYVDIVKNINDIVKMRNSCKLVINETLAKQFGFDIELYKENIKNSIESKKNIEQLTGEKLLVDDYISFSKNKNEICFKNNDKEALSHLFDFFLPRWKQDIHLLNNLESVYLAELRDALLPDLMSGKMNL